MGQRAHWMPVAVTTAVAALLACAAVITANQAACDEPGSYVFAPGGVELVGGCLRGDDLPVDLPVAPPPPEDPPTPPVQSLGL